MLPLKLSRPLFTLFLLAITCPPLAAKTTNCNRCKAQEIPEQKQATESQLPPARNVLLEAKAAYFIPESSRFNNVFGGAGIYGLELSVQAINHWYGWASASALYKSGHSYGVADPSSTNILLVPLGIGLKYLYPVRCVDLWIGGGVLGEYMHLKQDSPYVTPVVCKWGVGGIVKAGAIIHVTKRFFINLFADYSFLTIPFNDSLNGTVTPHDVKTSGGSIGASLGWSFGTRPTK